MTGAALARFLIRNRSQIEARMTAQLGSAAPRASSAEAELLRRFRSYASATLSGSEAPEPALEGVRVHDRRAAALLDHWITAASAAGGEHAPAIEEALRPLSQTLVGRLRQGASPRRARGAPRAKRRAVSAAIDRVADAFLAIEADSAQIVDANPAAGSLLGVARDALLGVDAMQFVAPERHAAWWTELDSMAEGGEPRRFEESLRDAHGREVSVSCSLTRFATRDRTLALVLARPT
ncbi:MAG: PAS domain-containing protein [Myxococcota bacterium]